MALWMSCQRNISYLVAFSDNFRDFPECGSIGYARHSRDINLFSPMLVRYDGSGPTRSYEGVDTAQHVFDGV